MTDTTLIVIEVRGGVVQAVYGDEPPAGSRLDVIVRDWDNIEAGDPDPMGDEYEPEHLYY